MYFFMFFSFLAKAQNIEEKVSTTALGMKKDATKASLDQVFAMKVLNAYQESSKTKIEDLFNYFQMLTDALLEDDLKKEIIENIHQLYQNSNAPIIDFTTDSMDKVALDQFIQKLLISEPIVFKVSDESKYDSITYRSWNTGYTITKTKSGVTTKTKVIQLVYMIQSNKDFGSSNKVVYQVNLGEMQ